MTPFESLIKTYLAAGQDGTTVAAWFARNSRTVEMLSELAEYIGDAFLARRIDFWAANGLLNQLMVQVGFEMAPAKFWEYYVVFENFETSTDPEAEARPAVAALQEAGKR